MKQGEKLIYAGRIQRRTRGSSGDFEVIEDLTPYGIKIALSSYGVMAHQFKVYKEEGGFFTDAFDTTHRAETYTVEASLILDETQVVARNTAKISVESSVLGKDIGKTLPQSTPEPESESSGSIEPGEWEYQIELARSGSEAEINRWSDTSKAVALALGVVLKGDMGDAFTYDDFTTEQIEELQQPATDAAAEVLAVNMWEQCNTSQSYVSTTNLTSKTISTTEDHRSMTHDVEVGEATHVTWQIWNPNLVDNTVEEVESRIANRFTFYDKDNTHVVGYEDLPSLDGSSYQTGVIEVPDDAYWVRLGFIMGYSGDDEQTYDADIYAMVEVGDVAHSYRKSKADLKEELKGDTGDVNLMSFGIVDGELMAYVPDGGNLEPALNNSGELIIKISD